MTFRFNHFVLLLLNHQCANKLNLHYFLSKILLWKITLERALILHELIMLNAYVSGVVHVYTIIVLLF